MAERKPIQFKPGVVRQGSEAEMQGNWYESNLVRWVGGVMRPVAGWEKLLYSIPAFASPIRAMHIWVVRTTGIRYTGVLCEKNLYVIDQGGTVTDITPAGGIQAPGSTTQGGYGDGLYDVGTYDTPRPDKPDTIQAGPSWTIANFGDDLIAMASADRRLLRWKPSDPGGTLATAVPTSPLGRTFVVTPERHVMIFQSGAFFNRFDWCGQENIEDWDYADLESSASYYEIEPASPFLSAIATRFGILAFTVVGTYFIRYVGAPYFYTYEFLGHYNVPVATAALTGMADTVVWYATDGFWQFDGNTVSPLGCPILDWIQTTIDPLWQFRRTAGLFLGMQSEIWWFLPAKGAKENTHYVSYNFDEKWWAMGKLGRTCGVTGSSINYPLMSDGSQIFQHEKGLFYYDAPELPYAQTAAIQIADGGRLVTARRGLVDTRAPAGDVVFYVTGKRHRISDGDPALVDFSEALPVKREGGKLAFRVTGRDLIIRIQSQRSGVEPWTFGKFLVDLKPRGRR